MVKLAQLIGTHYRYDDESAAVWRSARTRLLWVGTLSSVAFVALYIVAVTTKSGQYFDNAVLAGHKVQDSWFRWAILRRAARHAVLPLAVGAFAAFAIAVYRRRYHQAVAAAVVVGGSFVTTEILKFWVLKRPDIVGAYWVHNTFPSGHTTAAVSVAVGLVLVVPQRWRGKVATVVALCAMLVANGTLALGWHRASDAMGSCLLVCVWFAIAVGLMIRAGWAGPAHPGRASQLSRASFPMLAIGGICWTFGIIRLGSDLRTVRSRIVSDAPTLVHIYLTADLLVIASVATTMVVCLVCMRGISDHR